MKSGLEDRNNNPMFVPTQYLDRIVSMNSGLEDRNNKKRHFPIIQVKGSQ